MHWQPSDVNQGVVNLTALITAITALVVAFRNRDKAKGLDNRLSTLENGGGDKKIDARLAQHKLIDRRGGQPENLPPTGANGEGEQDVQ